MKNLVSIVTPMYNEAEVIAQYFENVNKIIAETTATNPDIQFEIVIVNDGSRDDTLQKLRIQQEQQSNLTVVNFSQNFGQEPAVFAGVEYSAGDAVIVMDADMQDPPELIGQMVAKWQEGYDVVNARRTCRKTDSFFQRITAKYYYKAIDKLSYKVKYPENVNNFRLISRRVADVILKFPSNEKLFRNAVAQAGFKVTDIEFVRSARAAGRSSNNKKAMWRLSLQGFADSTTKPLNFTFKLSLWFMFLGFALVIAALTLAIMGECGVTFAVKTCESYLFGIGAMFSTIMLFSGIILLTLNITNFYLGKTFNEIKGRPMYIVEQVFKSEMNK